MPTSNSVSVDEKTFILVRDLIFAERGKLQPDVADVACPSWPAPFRPVIYFFRHADAEAFQELCNNL